MDTPLTEYTYRYDGNGCLTNILEGTQSAQGFSYDYDNRIVSAKGAGSAATEYIYDASGARIGRISGATTNYFVIDYTDGLKRPLAETDASGSIVRYYVWAGMRLLCHIEANGDVFYYHSDELGSSLALTDSAGAVTDQFAYLPYGQVCNRTGTTQTPFLWLGSFGVYYDSETELHLTLHRAYSSQMKRFIHPDPLGIDGGPNVYAYAALNPLLLIDPLGLYEYETTSLWVAFAHEINPFNLDGTFWQGSAAYVDGIIPIFDPFESSGVYDSDVETSFKASQAIGAVVRDIELVLSGGALGHAAKSGGISTTAGQRFIMGEFGPSYASLLLSESPVATSSLAMGYLMKTIERVDTGIKLYDAFFPETDLPLFDDGTIYTDLGAWEKFYYDTKIQK